MTTESSTDTQEAPFALDATVGEFHGEFSFPMNGLGRLPIRVTRDDDGTFLALDLVTDSYGVGFSAAEAIGNLASAVHRHHQFLRHEGPAGLSDRLASQLQILDRAGAPSRQVPRREQSSGTVWNRVYAA